MAMTGNRELGFVLEREPLAANASKDGNKRANYTILTQVGSDKKY